MELFTLWRCRLMVVWTSTTKRVPHMGQVTAMLSALEISSGRRVVQTTCLGNQMTTILTATLGQDLRVHAAPRLTSGNQTRCPVPTQCIPASQLAKEWCTVRVTTTVV